MQFVSEVTDEDIKRERRIARKLRKSAWWKRKCFYGKCYYCNTKVHPNDLTMDHIVPIIRGGRSTKINIVTACKECNSRKRYMLPMEWDEYISNLQTT